MSDIDAIKATINNWNNGLDDGDIEQMIAICHPGVITVNNRKPTTVGAQYIRDKYVPRIAAATIKSRLDIEHIKVYGDVAIVVGHFHGEMTDKISKEVRNASGRLVLVYKRSDDGSWKMILDMDNNDPND